MLLNYTPHFKNEATCNAMLLEGSRRDCNMVEGVVEAVDGGMAQIENIGEMWDRLCGSATGGLVIILCA